MSAIYEWLISSGQGGDAFDRHVFACAVSTALIDAEQPLTASLGLSRRQLMVMLARYFPGASWLGADLPEHEAPDGGVEAHLRRGLERFAAAGDEAAEWLAAMVARRAACAESIWEALGLHGQADWTRILDRHFPMLARLPQAA